MILKVTWTTIWVVTTSNLSFAFMLSSYSTVYWLSLYCTVITPSAANFIILFYLLSVFVYTVVWSGFVGPCSSLLLCPMHSGSSLSSFLAPSSSYILESGQTNPNLGRSKSSISGEKFIFFRKNLENWNVK